MWIKPMSRSVRNIGTEEDAKDDIEEANMTRMGKRK